MDFIHGVSLVLILLGLFSSNMVTWILYRYHSSILYIRRNILTYLSMLLVFCMNLTSNATVKNQTFNRLVNEIILECWVAVSPDHWKSTSSSCQSLQWLSLPRILHVPRYQRQHHRLQDPPRHQGFKFDCWTWFYFDSSAAWQVLECWPWESVPHDLLTSLHLLCRHNLLSWGLSCSLLRR